MMARTSKPKANRSTVRPDPRGTRTSTDNERWMLVLYRQLHASYQVSLLSSLKQWIACYGVGGKGGTGGRVTRAGYIIEGKLHRHEAR